ncbi:hypothetical protein TNCV_2615751 [Trichonephila clavipes]|nr:hypothetical protein TNCV_2615751 [Trichonephila clavipes]
MTPELAPPSLLISTPHQREDVYCPSPTRRLFRGTWLEFMTHQPLVRYLDHYDTKALEGGVGRLPPSVALVECQSDIK